MGGLYCCIVAFTHLGNVTGHRTATLAAPLSRCGPVMYEAGLHGEFTKKGLLVYKGMDAGDGLD